jgi:beta-aspartyl-dipeptidase (metallo-type)
MVFQEEPMFKLITQGQVFGPQNLGVQDILIGGTQIVRIDKDLSSLGQSLDATVIGADGKMVTPGFIDPHVHFLGGGDYEGPAGATTDIHFSSLTKAGITTAVGCLGSDDTARNVLDLIRRAQDLEKLGITTYVYTGSFNVPAPTITGSVRNDVMMIDKVLGVKFAISEAMASLVSLDELGEVAKDSFLGGLISGKRGVIHIHVGKKPGRMDPLFELLKLTDIPIDNFYPTHVNRSEPNVLEQAIEFMKMGGTVDISAITSPETGSPTGIRVDQALNAFLKAGVPVEQVTLSSDGNVSMPIFDENGNKTGLYNAGTDFLYRMFLKIIENCDISFSDALKICTANVSRTLGLESRKGSIEVGKDADLILFGKNYDIDSVLARGQLMVQDGKVLVRGPFE